LRDHFLAAKKVAIALHTLNLDPVPPPTSSASSAFPTVAREIKAEELPEVSWDFVYGTTCSTACSSAGASWPTGPVRNRSS